MRSFIPPNIEAFLFDLDGVLIDSEPLHNAAIIEVLGRHGVSPPPGFFDDFIGQTDRKVFEGLIDRYAEAPLDPDLLLADKHRAYAERAKNLWMITGARAFLDRVRAMGQPTALVTSSTPESVVQAAKVFPIDSLFEVVITAADVAHTKPDPEPYRTAAERLQCDPAHCVVIEDSANGIRSARAAGCFAIALTTSFSADVLREAGAHLIVDQYDELVEHLFNGH